MKQSIRQTTQFKKDIRRSIRRGKDVGKLKDAISKIFSESPLDPGFRDHELVGPFKGIRDLHLEPDWILLYQITDTELILVRTGTHSDLFRSSK